MEVVCPKCTYTRTENESAPEWQCPSCGIAYAKFKSAITNPSTIATNKVRSSRVNRESDDANSADRIAGLFIFLVFGLTAVFLWNYLSHNYTGPGVIFIPLVIAVYAAHGLIEFVTGRSVKDVEESWARMGGFQKFVMGSLIVSVGGVLAFIIVGMFLR